MQLAKYTVLTVKNDELEDLKKIYTSWSTEDLLKVLKYERNQYRPEAINLIEEELRKRGIDNKEIATTQVIAKESYKKKQEKEKRKIGGWLLLFIIILGLNISYLFSSIFTSIPNTNITALQNSGLGLFGLTTFICLILKLKFAPTLAKLYLGLSILINIVIIIIISFGNYFNQNTKLIMIGVIIIQSLIQLLWLLYFIRSKRVAITYGLKKKNQNDSNKS